MVVAKRNPDQTRTKILQAAFVEIQRHGFRSAGLDRILADTGLTKGALYYHFPNKAALGYAVVDELIGGKIREMWLEPLERYDDPIEGLLKLIAAFPPEKLASAAETGCPLNNLAQEMSAVDDEFRRRVETVFQMWIQGVAECLEFGQAAGGVRPDVDCRQAATYFVASIEGAMGLAKNARDPRVLLNCMAGLGRYLESLRASRSGA